MKRKVERLNTLEQIIIETSIDLLLLHQRWRQASSMKYPERKKIVIRIGKIRLLIWLSVDADNPDFMLFI